MSKSRDDYEDLIKMDLKALRTTASKLQHQIAQQKLNLKRYGYEPLWDDNLSIKGIDKFSEYQQKEKLASAILRGKQIKSLDSYTKRGYEQVMSNVVSGGKMGKFVKAKMSHGQLQQAKVVTDTGKEVSAEGLSKLMNAWHKISESKGVREYYLKSTMNNLAEWYAEEDWDALSEDDIMARIEDRMAEQYEEEELKRKNLYKMNNKANIL